LYISDLELIKEKLSVEGRLSTSDIIKKIIEDDTGNPQKAFMSIGERYYDGDHDILRHDFRRSTIYEDDANGNPVGREFENENNSNHHNVHNFHQQHVDQKVAYISGRPASVTVEGAEDNAELKTFEDMITAVTSDEEFSDTLSDLETGASNKGVEWLHVYYDKSGNFQYVIVPAEGCIPLYDTQYQKELVEMIRYYEIAVVRPGGDVIRKHVEWWTASDVSHYTEDDNGEYIFERRLPHWYGITSIDEREVRREGHGWGRVPFIPLYNNSRQMSDLTRNKGLIDAYNLISSSSTNNQIDLVELYFMIQGYGGETAKAIQQKLKINKAVSVSDPNGKIQAQQVSLDVSDRLEWLKMLRRDIYHLGMAIDTDDETFGSAPSGVALKFKYTQLDLKSDKMIVKLKKAMKEFFWFLTEDLNRKNNTVYDASLVRFDANKSMITNDLETVQIISQSQGLVPDTLLLAKHPYVDDVNQAIKELKKQKREEAEAYSSYERMTPGGGGDGDAE